MKVKVLILNRAQFGYHRDTYCYCKHGRYDLDISYVGFDAERPRLLLDGVKVKYVSRDGNIIVRYLRLLSSFICECRKDYDVTFLTYFPGCFALRVFNPYKPIVFDVRTGSVSQNSLKRKWNNFILRLESHFFKHISVISQSLVEKLKLPEHKVSILPIGAEPVDIPDKQFGSIRLLYVGTLTGRRIEDTVVGFARFFSEYGESLAITYDIVGNGYNDELDELKHLINKMGLSNAIRLPGYIHQNQLKEYYRKSNIGISYVPINDIYNCQPPTKTLEYILAGMPVIATATKENKAIIKRSNGILIDDNSESFYEGLVTINEIKHEINSTIIKESCHTCTWKLIVKELFVPYLENIIKE